MKHKKVVIRGGLFIIKRINMKTIKDICGFINRIEGSNKKCKISFHLNNSNELICELDDITIETGDYILKFHGEPIHVINKKGIEKNRTGE